MDGRTVKGVNFVDLRDAGDPVELAKQYGMGMVALRNTNHWMRG